MSGWRTSGGTAIDRSRPIRFTFNETGYTGFEGDTLASALIANGVTVVGRSFKYHRKRGIFGYGAEEPNALVQIGEGARAEPNLKATEIRLVEGLVARSQNCWPSVGFDLLAVNDLFAPLIPAGFYYKLFKWPVSAWPLYERLIRRAAGMGRAPRLPDPDRYETLHRHFDLLVIGGGITGLAAADSAAAAGARVLVVDDRADFGGMLADPDAVVEGRDAACWVRATLSRLAAYPGVTLLSRATAFGHYDGDLVAVVEQTGALPRLRRWLVQADRMVLASGAFERPLLFQRNDLPGVMLASAARHYLHHQGVAAGRRCVVFANNDTGYAAAMELHRAGARVSAIVDPRAASVSGAGKAAQDAGIMVLHGHTLIRAAGRGSVKACIVSPVRTPGAGRRAMRRIACDVILTAGGWSPAAHLFTHAGGALRYEPAVDAMVPDPASARMIAAGACAGIFAADDCVASGRAAGAGQRLKLPAAGPDAAPVMDIPRDQAKLFVDLQNDVTVRDVLLAVREGYRSVEHVKRYTTLGMGTDQGKTAGLNGVALIAAARGLDVASVGNSRPRPPFSPVTFGVLASGFVGAGSVPARTTPINAWHEAHGATMANVGNWRRPQLYRRGVETDLQAVNREALNVRSGLGLTDVSTLGKIDLQGPDVARLLNHVYVNDWSGLKPGRCRYGVMVREDGMVLDDGTVTRLSDDRWFMTTTTGNAERILANLERARQIDLPGLDVSITLVTEQWGAMALAGPRARDVLQALSPSFAFDNASLAFMRMAEGELGGIAARVLRVSFSGELAYEIYTRSGDTLRMWETLLAAGKDFGVMPYGTEAMMTLRIEKGLFVPGFEADGRTTPDDLGLRRMLSTKKEFVGRRSLGRPAFLAPDRKQMVGLLTVDPAEAIPRGAQIIVPGTEGAASPIRGNVTSVAFSPNLDRWIALALVAGGRAAIGEQRIAASPLTGERVAVSICDPVFIDPQGVRLRE